MDAAVDFALRALLIGIGATLVLDAWTVVLRRAFGIRAPDWALVGRWIGHVPRGRFRHAGIAAAAPVRGERPLGWCFHYATGIAFAAALLAANGTAWARQPTLLPCLVLGLLTVVLPWFVMQPALGAGIASSRTPNPTQARMRSLATHAVFGFGLYLAALATATILR
ncbi:DUF2938 domain-containing protein [Luteimonas notoginsengisoli]|uniref:DUF2938 domain-containing protein n=1 Tax=Luteimonas notoginsengisoli TaxID=1578200 RepID=A0ABV7UWG5_9GAMM